MRLLPSAAFIKVLVCLHLLKLSLKVAENVQSVTQEEGN